MMSRCCHSRYKPVCFKYARLQHATHPPQITMIGMKKVDIDPNWWRGVIAPIAVASALIVAAGISGLPSATCATLAKTYIAAIYNFGFSAVLASSLFLLCMLVSATADSKIIGPGKMPTHVFGVLATVLAIVIFALAITVGLNNLEKSIADCYPGPKGEAATHKDN